MAMANLKNKKVRNSSKLKLLTSIFWHLPSSLRMANRLLLLRLDWLLAQKRLLLALEVLVDPVFRWLIFQFSNLEYC